MGSSDPAAGSSSLLEPRVARPAGLAGTTLLHTWLVGHSFPPHLHDFYVVGWNERGWETFWCLDTQWWAGPLTLQLINPGEVHTGETLGPSGQVYRAVYLEPEALRDFFGAGRRGRAVPRFVRPLVDDPGLASELLAAHRMLLEEPSREAGASRLLEALARLFSKHATMPSGGEAANSRRPEVASTREHIERHYAGPVRLADLARRVDMSRHHLLRLFKREVGLPPHRYLLQVRVEKAKELLVRGRPLAETALEVGFCHQSHFTEHFRRLVGVTPGCYARLRDGTPAAGVTTVRSVSRSATS